MSLPRSVLGALIVLLALNLLGWGIIAYDGKTREGLNQTRLHERSGFLDRQAALENQLGELTAELKSESDRSNARAAEIEARQTAINDLKRQLRVQTEAQGDLEALRANLGAEQQAGAERLAKLAAELDAYRQKINLRKSNLSARVATLAARDREIAKAEERLAFLGDLESLRATIALEETVLADQQAKFAKQLDGYRRKVNLARSGLSGRTATLAARDREIVKAEERLTALGGEIQSAEAALGELNRALVKRDEVERALAAGESRLGSLRNDLTTRLAVLGSLDSKVEKQRDVAGRELAAGEEALLALGNRIETRQRDLAAVTTELETRTRDLATAEQRLAETEGERDKTKTVLAGLLQQRDREVAALGDIESLERQVEVANTDFAANREKLALAEEELTNAEAALARTNEQVQALEDRAAALDRDIETKDARLLEIEAGASASEDRLSAAEKALEERQQHIDGSETRIAALKVDENKTRVMLSGLQAKLAEQREISVDIKSLEATAERVHADLEAAGLDLEVRLDAVQDAETRLADLEAALADGDTRLSAMTGELEVKQQEADRLEGVSARLAETGASLAEKEEALLDAGERHVTKLALLGSLGSKLERQRDLADNYATTEQDLAALRDEVVAVTGALAEHDQAVVEAEAHLDDLTVRIENADVDLETKIHALEEQDEKLAEATARLEQALATMSAAESDAASFLKELDVADAKKASIEQAIASLTETRAEAEAELSALEAKLASLEQDVEAEQDLLSTSLDQKAQSRAELEEMEQVLTVLEADLTAHQNDLVNMDAELAERKVALDTLVADLELKGRDRGYASAALQTLRADIAAANAELAALTKQKQALEAAIDGSTAAATDDGIDPLLRAFPVQTSEGVRIAHLLFNYSSAELSPGAARKVNEAAKWIKKNPVRRVRLVGYADAVGSSGSNKVLAEARANVTAATLVELGIKPETIAIEAAGEDVLVEATGEQVSEPLNRSVGIFIVE
ncbi:MAG: OmpA family protein [Geminicoccaceae bacterium]